MGLSATRSVEIELQPQDFEWVAQVSPLSLGHPLNIRPRHSLLLSRAPTIDTLRKKHFQERTAEPRISPRRSPEFSVETRGFDDLHAALFKESRMKSREPTKLHRKSGVWGTRRS